MTGRSIRIFLVDGTASGVRTAELGLSTIKALAVPRASLASVAKRPEIQKTGVYFLLGPDLDSPGKKKIYIGEGETIINRIAIHNTDEDKDFWEECVLFVSKDENLTKAHVRYLEACLISLASEAKRATIINRTSPAPAGRLPEPDEVEMNEFVSQARLLLGSLGYDIFEPHSIPSQISGTSSATATSQTSNERPIFQASGNGYSATCMLDQDAGKFIITADSTARKLEGDSLSLGYRNLRSQLIKNGVLADYNDQSYSFTQNYSFDAATPAAQVVSGTTVNGRIFWKTPSGQTFADWENARLPPDDGDDA